MKLAPKWGKGGWIQTQWPTQVNMDKTKWGTRQRAFREHHDHTDVVTDWQKQTWGDDTHPNWHTHEIPPNMPPSREESQRWYQECAQGRGPIIGKGDGKGHRNWTSYPEGGGNRLWGRANWTHSNPTGPTGWGEARPTDPVVQHEPLWPARQAQRREWWEAREWQQGTPKPKQRRR